MFLYLDDNDDYYQTNVRNNYSCQIFSSYQAGDDKKLSLGVLADYTGGLDTFFCPGMNFAGSSWHNRTPIQTQKAWNANPLLTGNASAGISSYMGPTYALGQLETGPNRKLGALEQTPALFSDALTVGFPSPYAPSDAPYMTEPNKAHNVEGFNVCSSDGSAEWFTINSLAATNSIGGRATQTDASYQGYASRFWSTISRFNLKYISIF